MLFKETKTSELIGAALNWAVAKCEGIISGDALDVGFILEGGYLPSTAWAQGAQIIEREGISINYGEVFWTAKTISGTGASGDTPLVAAMRCYVASKLGDVVDVPLELLEVS